jgi:WD40 repeat protein
MAEEPSQGPTEPTANQPRPPASPPVVLDYCHIPRRPSRVVQWLRRLPWPSWITVIVLLLAVAAAYWLKVDHAAWTVVREFDARLPVHNDQAGISADGRRLATIVNRGSTVRIFDLVTGKKVIDLTQSPPGAVCTALSPDGARICVTYYDGGPGQAILWDTSSGRKLSTWQFYDGGWLTPFSPDGRLLAVGGMLPLRICDGHTGNLLTTLNAVCSYPTFSPDGRYLAAEIQQSGDVRIWDCQTWRTIAEVPGNLRRKQDGAFAFSPDGKTMAVALDSGVWTLDLATQRFLTRVSPTSNPAGLSFSADGRYLVTDETDNIRKIWDVMSGRIVWTLTQHKSTLQVSPDGAYIGSERGVWSFPNLDPLAEFPQVGDYSNFAWLPDGRSFVTQSRDVYYAGRTPEDYPIRLFHRRRPEAIYGLLWLPQFWLALVGGIASIVLIYRDVRRWRRVPPRYAL